MVLGLAVGCAGNGMDASPPDASPFCGYDNQGTTLQVASGVEVCMPPVACTSETCPPTLGSCVSGHCVFVSGYTGVTTFPEAWATHYCGLAAGGCHGVTQVEYPEVTAAEVAAKLGDPVCDGSSSATGTCVGIAASSPMLVGNSEEAVDAETGMRVVDWGLGLTEASGLCYAIRGPGGSAVVALTDRCGGYCKCNGSGYQECGPCVNAADMQPNCPCVGSTPDSMCCGLDCATLVGQCDWCASNNHPHFDLDDATFAWVCGDEAERGSCQLSAVGFVACATPKAWPPGGTATSCAANSFGCATPGTHQDGVPGTQCCCNHDFCPQADGSCAAAPATCGAGSCACAPGMPDADHPAVPSTGCCCVFGAVPQADGSCF